MIKDKVLGKSENSGEINKALGVLREKLIYYNLILPNKETELLWLNKLAYSSLYFNISNMFLEDIYKLTNELAITPRIVINFDYSVVINSKKPKISAYMKFDLKANILNNMPL